MTEPIVLEFEVAAPPDHAFSTWVSRAGLWWPKSHTLTGGGAIDVIFEPRIGGRIYEKAADGAEHDWGEVVDWEPPHRLGCRWHLFFEPSEATDLEIGFAPTAAGTLVTIRQSGFERLGPAGEQRRANTDRAWSVIAGCLADALGAPGQSEAIST